MKKQLFALALAGGLLAGCETRKETTETTSETTVMEQETIMTDTVTTDPNAPVTGIEEASANVDSLLNDL